MNLIRFLIRYSFAWLIWSAVNRLVFMVFNMSNGFEISLTQAFKSFILGFYMDLSIWGYIMMLILLILTLGIAFFQKIPLKTIKWTSFFLIVLISALCSIDTILYKEWGFKLDASPLIYLDKANEAKNFLSISNTIYQVLIFLLLVVSGVWIFTVICLRYKSLIIPRKHILISLALLPLMILPVRGGWGTIPMNLGQVYFSKNTFANHTAVNTLWNVIYSLSEKDKLQTSYHFMSEMEELNIIKPYMNLSCDSLESVLNIENPKILLIMLESFTSKVLDVKLNDIEVTPNLNQWMKTELSFTNMYATGDRTDEGLVGIYSAFPSQPTSAIIHYPNKCRDLPSLYTPFQKSGYKTRFYYGGDISFANMGPYLYAMGVDSIIDKSQFSPSKYNAKWGVHDHLLFEKIADDIAQTKGDFFYSALSLSSHPPYDVPNEVVWAGSEEKQFLNTMHYTDESLGKLIETLKKLPIWKDLLIILVADHGARLPYDSDYFEPMRFAIPMVWMGGAVKKQKRVDQLCSQVDIASTLLQSCNRNSELFSNSRNILCTDFQPFAFFAFNNGFTVMKPNSEIVFLNDGMKLIEAKGDTSQLLKLGKAYLQNVTQRFKNY